MKLKILVASVSCLLCGVVCARTLYVAPQAGVDPTRDGTAAHPFGSLEEVRTALRQFRGQGENVSGTHVILREGIYPIEKTLLFEAQDSGAPGAPIVFEGEGKVILSGGIKLTGWKEVSPQRWEARLPPDAKGKLPYFETLYVNGKRAKRARYPNNGFIKMAKVMVSPMKGGETTKLKAKPGDFDLLKNLNPASFKFAHLVGHHKWEHTRRLIADFNEHAGTITTIGEAQKKWVPWDTTTSFFLENVSSALDEPGEWFYDGVFGKVVYLSQPNEKIEEAIFARPGLDVLLELRGETENCRTVVHDLVFKNITFAYSDSVRPEAKQKYANHFIRPAIYPPSIKKPLTEPGPSQWNAHQGAGWCVAAIFANAAHRITFEGCEITHTGEYGMWFLKGCVSNRVEKCAFTDLGAGGIRIASTSTLYQKLGLNERVSRPLPPEVTSDNVIDNCILAHGGRMHSSGVGVLIANSPFNRVTHCEISDFFYTGINVGWVYGYQGGNAQHNEIAFNRVRKIGQAEQADMGGIYTLGMLEGTCISNNIFCHVDSYSYGGWGIYPDEGSQGLTIENNLVYDTKDASFHQHFGTQNIVRNNIFCDNRETTVAQTRRESHPELTVERNVIYTHQGPMISTSRYARTTASNIKWRQNLWWHAKETGDFLGMDFNSWCKLVEDEGSLYADPLFVNPEKNDFRLKSDSPAIQRLGFKPFDFAQIGVYGSTQWVKRADETCPEYLSEIVRTPLPPPPEPQSCGIVGDLVSVDLATGAITPLGTTDVARVNVPCFKSTHMVFKKLPAGSYPIHCLGELRARPDKTVRFSQDIYVALFETTRAQYRHVMGFDPTRPDRALHTLGPVTGVSHQDILSPTGFMAQLTQRLKGAGHARLPTLAEWDVVARAGQNKTIYEVLKLKPTEFHKIRTFAWAWTPGEKEPFPHQVGTKSPTPWGAYDLFGNAWEWCADTILPKPRDFKPDQVQDVDPCWTRTQVQNWAPDGVEPLYVLRGTSSLDDYGHLFKPYFWGESGSHFDIGFRCVLVIKHIASVQDNAAPADELARRSYEAEIPTAPAGYRRPANWKGVLYAKNLHEIARTHSVETRARAAQQMKKVNEVIAKGPYKATGKSIDSHPCPEWFIDAKLGVFVDWGPWSIASWSPYVKGHRLYPDWYELRCRTDAKTIKYHAKNWGSDFKSDHLLDLFRGTKFHASELMKIFKACGARYVVPFLKHHSGFCLWDCSYTFRDTVDGSAKRDFTREMVDACRAEGLKFGFYTSQCSEWEYPILQEDGSLKIALNTPTNLVPYSPDMEWKCSGKIAVKDFVHDYIVPQSTEFIDQYDPDILWNDCDWATPATENGSYEVAAYFYNRAVGRKEVACNDRHGLAQPDEIKGRFTKRKRSWLRTVRGDFYTDEWGDTEECLDPAKWHPWESCSGISKAYGNHWMENFDASMVMTEKDFIIHFADIVARGGNLLLLVNLDPQGAFPEVQRQRLEQIGAWLKTYGEAIYATRICAPFNTPTIDYTKAKDDSAIYAIVKEPATQVTLSCALPEAVCVTVVGKDEKLTTHREGAHLVVSIPEELAKSPLPFALKCVGKQ